MSDFHIPDAESQFILAVGAVVTSANLTDLGLCALYVALLNSEVAGAVAFGQPFATTAQACRAAISFYPDNPLSQSALDAITQADALYKQRNQVAHGVWSGDTDENDQRRTGKSSDGVSRQRASGVREPCFNSQLTWLLLVAILGRLAKRLSQLEKILLSRPCEQQLTFS